MARIRLPRSSALFKEALWNQQRHLRQMTTPELRKEFTEFFVKDHGHVAVKSSSLIPHNDKSLMFTNAGMVQFKEYFRNPAVAPFKQATSIQKCMRAGGKHNDLDNVGYTPRHHTFFEMLGNFSFGQYSKAAAIQMAWRFLTEVIQLPKDRLRVTVLASDQESYDLWKNQEGIPEEKIIRCDEKDNFWTMGEGAGPCGPCTEIFWDTQNDDLGEDRWLEIWNLVFMQHYRNDQGQLENLPIVCVDTGMGLERLASVIQSKENNYETDVFGPLFEGLHKNMTDSGIESSRDINATPHKKIIVDHLRAMSFLIADGVIPSNVGRGYVLRRIIRRALRSGNQLGFTKPFMADLYGYLLESFKDGSYPELTERQDSIKGVIHQEEEIFMSTLSKGLALLEPVFKQKDLADSKQVPAEIAFKLYDTFGFPLDLTVLIAEERGWSVDLAKVEELKQKQQEQGRASWKATSSLVHAKAAEWKEQGVFPTFTGYHRENLTGQSSTVLASQSTDDGTGDMILSIEPCPFYGLGGGQSPDTGFVRLANGSEWKVVDVFSPYERGLAIRIQPASMEQESVTEEDLLCLHKGFQLTAFVDTKRREGVAAHHSATHMLNAALRKTLGKPIMQAGSLVEPDRLRFDFTHGKPISQNQIHEIENWINTTALQSVQPVIQEYPLQKAIDMGSIAVFSEKYGDVVRVVDFPKVSMELCGGTHVEDLSKIYPFKILSEGSVAAGTRRIEAAVGKSASQFLIEQDRMVTRLNQDLKAYATSAGNGLDLKVNKIKDQVADLSKQYSRLLEKMVKSPAAAPVQKGALRGLEADAVPVQIHELDGEILDQDYFSKKANFLKEQEPNAVHILIWKENMMVALVQKQFPTLHAGKVLKAVLEKAGGGKGGGQAQVARGKLSNGEEGLRKLIQLSTQSSSSSST
ncbi:alanyl-tRNA synthetase [Entomortierella parvispora]|uniref:Alanine--tRNA ligase n=1 Tax=Entomortierella parvispora TaxID=205924 RepID=A0A9P3HLT3_9FUNG|nr:alanyl-tRNA synthetase [Entomortierella parvispora]